MYKVPGNTTFAECEDYECQVPEVWPNMSMMGQ